MRKMRLLGSVGAISLLVVLLIGVVWVVQTLSSASLLSPGLVSTDVSVVSPDTDLPADVRTVEVTLTNPDLNFIKSVQAGGDIEPPTITVPALLAGDTFRIFINTLLGDAVGATIALPAGVTTGDLLPIVDSSGGPATATDITISAETGFTAGEISVSELISGASGRIRFVTSQAIATGSTFNINFFTSPQETALVNVRGDVDNIDVLLVEPPGGSGEYLGTFVVADQVIIDMGTGIGVHNTITHEQHDVPQGLRGNVLYEDQVNTTDGAADSGGGVTTITLLNPPIRSSTTGGPITTADVTVDSPADMVVTSIVSAITGVITITNNSTTDLVAGDQVQVTYRGSESFTFAVDFALVQDVNAPAGVDSGDLTALVVPSNRDTLMAFGDFFQILSFDGTTVRAAAIVGTDTGSDATIPSYVSVLGVSYLGSETVTVPLGVAARAAFTVAVDFPPEDANGDAVTNGTDVMIITGAGLLDPVTPVVNVFGGDVTFRAGAAPIVAGQTFTVAYAFEVGSDPQNALIPGANPRPIILVVTGSLVTVISSNDEVSVDAEADPPEFANPSPPNGGATSDLDQVLSIDIIATDSGVDTDSIAFYVSDDSDDFGESYIFDDLDKIIIATEFAFATVSASLADIDEALGPDFELDEDGVTDVRWWVGASDSAGNQGISDSDDGLGGNQPFSLRVDRTGPILVMAYTGEHWNPVDEQIEGDRRTGVGEFLPGQADPTLIRVEFSEILDGSTVSASDFEVDSLTPADALWFEASGENVFLAVDPPLVSDATPLVELVDLVRDPSGNPVFSGATTAVDGIGPIAIVTLDATRSTGNVVITVETDEPIRTLEPVVELFLSTADDPDIAQAIPSGVVVPRGTRLGDMSWQFSLAGLAPNRYSIVVIAEDSSRNSSTTGQQRWQDAGSISIEVDTALPRPIDGTGELTTNPLDGTSPSETDPFFIEINWLQEAGEYIGDTDSSVTLTKAVLDAGLADERDVLNLSSTTDNQRFSIAVPTIGLGAHTLTFSGQDSLGNTLIVDEVLTFTVVSPLVIGTVVLEGRSDHGGAVVTAIDRGGMSYATTTSANGSYGLSPPPGIYMVTVEKDGFLSAQRLNAVVEEDQVLRLPSVRLLGGDSDGNGIINVADLAIPAKNLGKNASDWP